MNFVVAPEPADWVEPLVRALRAAGEEASVYAPWSLPVAPPGWVPEPVALPWRRRSSVSDTRGENPVWWLADAALRAFGGTSVDRVLRSRVARRSACDRLASRAIPEGASTVYAPSLGARRVLAAAARRGIRTVLVEDLPSLRELHDDLDAAAIRWPDARFLLRFRAPATWVSEQRAERELTDRILVRTGHARRLRLAEGRRDVALAPSSAPPPIAPEPVRRPPRTLLLAGVAAARHGTFDLVEAIGARTDVTLLVRPGEGTEPADLLARPWVRVATSAQRARLVGVDLVVAPAWCETAPPELETARALGVPLLASNRAGARGEGPEPHAMVDALRAALR
jgi:hypothetical protein